MVLFSVSSDPCLAFPLHREVCPSLILVHARTRTHTHTQPQPLCQKEEREREEGKKNHPGSSHFKLARRGGA